MADAARDAAGRVSWASPPLTFRTAGPATSTCAVRFAATTDWGNGFVANVDITNTGDHALDTWTLTFTWPTSWQSVDSGWNATWTQSGATVRVVNADGNRVLSPGATTTVGFVGSYHGPNVAPTAFTLNGALCTS